MPFKNIFHTKCTVSVICSVRFLGLLRLAAEPGSFSENISGPAYGSAGPTDRTRCAQVTA